MLNWKKTRELMEEKGISNKEMARAVGVSEAMISYIVNGLREPSILILSRITTKLDCTIDELVIKERKA